MEAAEKVLTILADKLTSNICLPVFERASDWAARVVSFDQIPSSERHRATRNAQPATDIFFNFKLF
jgi:hypothetical protein